MSKANEKKHNHFIVFADNILCESITEDEATDTLDRETIHSCKKNRKNEEDFSFLDKNE